MVVYTVCCINYFYGAPPHFCKCMWKHLNNHFFPKCFSFFRIFYYYYYLFIFCLLYKYLQMLKYFCQFRRPAKAIVRVCMSLLWPNVLFCLRATLCSRIPDRGEEKHDTGSLQVEINFQEKLYLRSECTSAAASGLWPSHLEGAWAWRPH